MTSFATGFRPQANTIDFQFVFAFPSFEDNMTIFVRRSFTLVGLFSLFISNTTTDYFRILVILTIIVYIILMIYATIGDVKDKNKVTFETI